MLKTELSWIGSSCPLQMHTNNPIKLTNNSIGTFKTFSTVTDVYLS